MFLFIINVIIYYIYGHSSVGRAQVSKTWCREFESLCPCQNIFILRRLGGFYFTLVFCFILAYSGYVMMFNIIALIVEFFASFIFGGFILWIISFLIAKKVKKENFTFVNFILISFFIILPLLVIISNTIYLYVIDSTCSGETGGYRCASILLNLVFWFYPIHFGLALIFAISRKKSKLQKLESQKFKNNSR